MHEAWEFFKTLVNPESIIKLGLPLLLFVVHTEDDGEGGRIISARRATPHERKAYENAQR